MHYRLRSFLRVPAAAKVSVRARDYHLASILCNVSLGGAYLLSQERATVGIGDVFILSIGLTVGGRDAFIVVNGMVNRIEENGMAFRFLETDPETLRLLFEYIYPQTVSRICDAAGPSRSIEP